MPQRTINAWRRHFKSLELDAIDFKREQQLARDFFAIFNRHKLLRAGTVNGRRPRQIDRDAQQTGSGTLGFHQVIAQPGYGLLNNFFQCHL